MTLQSKIGFLACLTVLLLPGSNRCFAQQEGAKPLVEVEWLAANLGDDQLRVLDLAHRVKDYNKGHIPGALFVNWKADIINPEKADRYTLPDRKSWEELLCRLGVTENTHIVLTDNMDSRPSVRMYWTLKVYGHENVSVLNGGTDAWQSAGRDLSAKTVDVQPSEYKVTQTNTNLLAQMQQVVAAIDGGSAHLIDGRPENQYTGEAPGKVFNTGKEHLRRGHAHTAINIPWKQNLDEDGKFKDVSELKAIYAAHGIKPGDDVITYCNEGLHAAMPWFVLFELLDEKQITLYDDSMAEWANRTDTPMNEPKDRE